MTFAELVNLINQKVLSGGARTKANAMREVLTEIAREATDDDDRIDDIESDVSSLQSSVATLDSRLDTAETDIDNLQTTATSLDSRLDTAETDIDNLQTADTALDSRLDTLEGQNLDSRLTSAETTIADHETRIDDLEASAVDDSTLVHKTGNESITGNKTFGSLDNFIIYDDGYAEAKYNSSTYSRMTSSELLVTNSSSSNTQAPLYQQFTDIATGFWQKIQRAASVLANATFYLPATGGTLATESYAQSLFAANDAMQYKGAIDCSSNPNYPAADKGHTYRISVAGKIGGASGVNVEVGDFLTCIVDGSTSGNQATVGSNWNIVQSNIDGAVVGPSSSTSGNLPTFSGTTGKTIQDSGKSINTGSYTGLSTKIATEDVALAEIKKQAKKAALKYG